MVLFFFLLGALFICRLMFDYAVTFQEKLDVFLLIPAINVIVFKQHLDQLFELILSTMIANENARRVRNDQLNCISI